MEKSFYINYKNTPFLKTSKSAAHPNRLNWRCEILLTRNQEAIKGKKILDLASHDGRFSYACLRLGAKHVTGVECRPHLFKYAQGNLINLGCKSQSFDFIHNDVFDYLPKVRPREFDTILCFGFFYHTIRQIELLREIKRIQPKYLILDTFMEKDLIEKDFNARNILFRLAKLIPKIRLKHFIKANTSIRKVINALNENRACLVFKYESCRGEFATIDPINLVAWPTKSFVELFLNKCGFNLKQLHWSKKEIKDWIAIRDYKTGKRVSYIVQLF